MMRHLDLRFAFRLLVALLCLPTAVSNVQAQEDPFEVFEIDMGTVGLDTLKLWSPSSVFRPIDMIDIRAGASGWAMGGAHVAGVEGLESVSWNPAGLGWLERTDLQADLLWIRSSGTTSGFPDTFNIPDVSLINVTRYEVRLKSGVRYNMLGAARSTTRLGQMRIGGAVTFRRYMDMAYPEEIVEDLTLAEGGSFPVTIAIDGTEEGGVDALAVSVGVQVVPDMISVGANLNYLNGGLRSSKQAEIRTGGPQSVGGGSKLRFDYSGFSTDLGLQLRLPDRFGVGIRYTPEYTLEVTNGSFTSLSLAAPETPTIMLRARIADYDMAVPPLLTVGGIFHPRDWLSVAVDYSQQNWSEVKVTYHDKERTSSPSLPLRDVTSFNIGLEGRFVTIKRVGFPLRIGYRTGPLSVAQLEPRGNVLDGDWAGGEIDAQAVTFGVGLVSGPLRWDLAYEVLDYRLKKFYFDAPVDLLVNPESAVVDVDRRVNRLRLSATLGL